MELSDSPYKQHFIRKALISPWLTRICKCVFSRLVIALSYCAGGTKYVVKGKFTQSKEAMTWATTYVCSPHPGMHRNHEHNGHTSPQPLLAHSDTVLHHYNPQQWSQIYCSYREGSQVQYLGRNIQAVGRKSISAKFHRSLKQK